MTERSTPPTERDQQQLLRAATYASVGTAALIIAAKLVGWVMTDSLAMLASLIDSIMDMIVSVINLIAIRYALQPPDEEHRFGHGKAEDLAAFTQSAFIACSALLIAAEAITRFSAPQATENTALGIGILIFSTIITLGLVLFQRHVMTVTKSQVIAADSVHYASDIWVNLAIVLSLATASFFQRNWVDPLFAIFIALYMLKGASQIMQSAFRNLMDHEFSDNDKNIILAIIETHPEVIGVHEMRTRLSGNTPFIQFHLEMEGSITLYQAHLISDEIVAAILNIFPNAEIFIHQDPAYRA